MVVTRKGAAGTCPSASATGDGTLVCTLQSNVSPLTAVPSETNHACTRPAVSTASPASSTIVTRGSVQVQSTVAVALNSSVATDTIQIQTTKPVAVSSSITTNSDENHSKVKQETSEIPAADATSGCTSTSSTSMTVAERLSGKPTGKPLLLLDQDQSSEIKHTGKPLLLSDQDQSSEIKRFGTTLISDRDQSSEIKGTGKSLLLSDQDQSSEIKRPGKPLLLSDQSSEIKRTGKSLLSDRDQSSEIKHTGKPLLLSYQGQSSEIKRTGKSLLLSDQDQSSEIKHIPPQTKFSQSSAAGMTVPGSATGNLFSHFKLNKPVQNTTSLLVSGSRQSTKATPAPAVQYKLVFQTQASAPVTTVQQPTVPSSVSLGLSSVFTSKTFSTNVAASTPTAYTVCTTQSKDGGPFQTILVPVSQHVPSQAVSVASMSSSSILGPLLARPVAVDETNRPTATPFVSSVAGTTPAVPVNISNINSTSAFILKGAEISAAPIDSVQSNSNTFVLAPPSSAICTQSAASNSVSQTLYRLANTAKADMTSTNVISSAVCPEPVSTVMFTEVPAARTEGHSAAKTSVTENETISWDKQSTLKLIELYKEYRAHLGDPQYKKKSVWELMAKKLRQSRKDGPPFRWNHVENKWKNMTKKYRDCIDMNRRTGNTFKCNYFNEIAEIYKYSPDEMDRRKAAEGLRALKFAPLTQNGSLFPKSCNRSAAVGMLDGSGISLKVEESSDGKASCQFLASELEPEAILVKKKKYTDKPCIGDASSQFVSEEEPGTMLVKKKKYAQLEAQSSVSKSYVPVFAGPTPSQTNINLEEISETGSIDVVSVLNQLREDRVKQDQAKMDHLEQMHKEKMRMFEQFLTILKQSAKKD